MLFEPLKGHPDLEQHGGRTAAGVLARVMQRTLALASVTWLNGKVGLPVHRSPTAYDHWASPGFIHLAFPMPERGPGIRLTRTWRAIRLL
jgi:hypothetical protein